LLRIKAKDTNLLVTGVETGVGLDLWGGGRGWGAH
jgi:hypothetical protein